MNVIPAGCFFIFFLFFPKYFGLNSCLGGVVQSGLSSAHSMLWFNPVERWVLFRLITNCGIKLKLQQFPPSVVGPHVHISLEYIKATLHLHKVFYLSNLHHHYHLHLVLSIWGLLDEFYYFTIKNLHIYHYNQKGNKKPRGLLLFTFGIP